MGISVVFSGECSDNAVDLYLRYWICFISYYDLEIFVVYLFFFSFLSFFPPPECCYYIFIYT